MAQQVVRLINNGALTLELPRLIRALENKEAEAIAAGAKRAQQVSRGGFAYLRPANAPPRPGRSSTGGKLRKKVTWGVVDGQAALDIERLDREAPHWIIQEIGTGQRATLRRGGSKNPQGRPSSFPGADRYVRTVRPQAGRRITAGLAFGTSPSGIYTPPGFASGQQLYYRNFLGGAMLFKPRPIIISKEIKGQHFVQRGAKAGWDEYRTSTVAAARRLFSHRKYRP